MALIVIDAGHGGFDNGAMYQGRKEKDDNLRLALAVGDMLKQRGYDVIFTPGRVYPERACKQRLCRPWHRGENRACGASQDRDARSAH